MEEAKSTYIVFLPYSENVWYYSIDDLKRHSITKDKLFKYVETLINYKDIVKVTDFTQRFAPFIINMKTKEIQELKKEKETESYYHNMLEQEIAEALKLVNQHKPAHHQDLAKMKEIDSVFGRFSKLNF